MKGLEVKKEMCADASRNLPKKDLSKDVTMKEAYVLIKDKINLDNYDFDNSSNSTIPVNNSFNYHSEPL